MATRKVELTDINNNNEIYVYNELGFFNYNKTPRIKLITKNKQGKTRYFTAVYKKHKKIFEIEMPDFSHDDSTAIQLLLSQLEEKFEELSIQKVHICQNDDLFRFFPVQNFKHVGNNVLHSIRILISNNAKLIDNEEEKTSIMRQMHEDPIDGGHCGQRRLYAKIRTKYFWNYMLKDIQSFVRKCHKCQINKSYIKTKEELTITETPCKPFDIITIDTVGPLPKSDNNNLYAVTMICNLTKYLVSIPIPNKESRTIAKAIFDNFISIYGPMKKHYLIEVQNTKIKL